MSGTRHRLQNREKMKYGKIQPVEICTARLTNGGNMLAQTPNGWAFVTPKGEIVRHPDDQTEHWGQTELEHLLQVCPEIQFTSKPVWLRQPRRKMPDAAWHVIARYCVEEDFSHYRWATGSNGGDYGFWTTRTVFARKIDGKIEAGYIDRKGTTADFRYTDCGSFQNETATTWATDVVGGFGFMTLAYNGDTSDSECPLASMEWFVPLPGFDGNLPLADEGLTTPTRREVVAACRAAGMFLSNDRAFRADWWGARPRSRRNPSKSGR